MIEQEKSLVENVIELIVLGFLHEKNYKTTDKLFEAISNYPLKIDIIKHLEIKHSNIAHTINTLREEGLVDYNNELGVYSLTKRGKEKVDFCHSLIYPSQGFN